MIISFDKNKSTVWGLFGLDDKRADMLLTLCSITFTGWLKNSLVTLSKKGIVSTQYVVENCMMLANNEREQLFIAFVCGANLTTCREAIQNLGFNLENVR